MNPKWLQYETVYYTVLDNPTTIKKVAMFDLDWTLVRPAKSKFPKGYDDNVIMDHRIEGLMKYINAGYSIVIITNQKLTPRELLGDKIARMNDVLKRFHLEGVDLMILMATQDDKYKKPHVGMYNLLFQLMPNIETGLYCGDAAGRPGDFSDSDLQFAINSGVPFYTPEQLFNI